MGLFSSGTKMTSLGQQKGFDVHALGDKLYFLKPKTPTDRAIISAHGGHALVSGTNTFVVPNGVTLRFYSDDTYSVEDPGFKEFYQKDATIRETLVGNNHVTCFDYILTKYQGSHNKMGETYDSIARVINEEARMLQSYDDNLFTARISHAPARSITRLQQGRAKILVPAVVTVRNRRFASNMTLSVLLNAVLAAAPEIKVFDCLFCRSTLFGGSQPVTLRSR